MIANQESQTQGKAKPDVEMPRWVAERLQQGKSVNSSVLEVVEQIRVKAKAKKVLNVGTLDQLLRGKERKINVKISMSGEDCKQEYAQLFSGVGLIRGEYQIRKNMMWITVPEMQKISRDYVESVVKTFVGKDVWYRTIEVPTSWVNVLDGCDHKVNENYDTVIGLRGIRRSLAFPEAFLQELEPIAEISRKYSNLNIMFPFVHDVSELRAAKEYLKIVGFNGKVGMMTEIPSAILCLEEFLQEGVDCLTVGLNDLTALTLGSLRTVPIYNNTHPAVFKMMKMVREKTNGSKVEIVVAGHHNPGSIVNSEKLGFDAVSIFVPDLSTALK